MLRVSRLALSAVLAVSVVASACSGKEEKKNGKAAASAKAGGASEAKPTGEGKPSPATTSPSATAKSGDVGDAEAMGKEACTLLSKAEADQILGKPSSEAKPGMFSCTWQVEGEMRMLMVELRAPSAYDMARQMEPKAEDLSGIGDKAFFGTMGAAHVVFVKNGKYVHIALIGGDANADKKVVIDWAKKLATRI